MCEVCGSDNVVRNGTSTSNRQRWLCRDCGRTSGRPGQLVAKVRRLTGMGFDKHRVANLMNVPVETIEDWVDDA